MLLDCPHHHDILLRCSAYRALRLGLVGILHNGRCLRRQTLLLDIARSDSAWSRWYKIQPDSVHIFLRRDGMFQGNKECKMLAMFPADRIPRDMRGMQLPSRLNPGTVQWHNLSREFPLLLLDNFRSGCSRVRGCSHQRRSSCSSVACLCWCIDPCRSLCMSSAWRRHCIFQGRKGDNFLGPSLTDKIQLDKNHTE